MTISLGMTINTVQYANIALSVMHHQRTIGTMMTHAANINSKNETRHQESQQIVAIKYKSQILQRTIAVRPDDHVYRPGASLTFLFRELS